MVRAKSPSPPIEIPSSDMWTAPISWTNSPLRPIENYSRDFPPTTVFTRCELIYTLTEEIGPGSRRETERALPGLLRLEKMKPVEVHVLGFDSSCWTYRIGKRGRKTVWEWTVGAEWPADQPAPEELKRKYLVDRIVVQSLLPAYGTNKPISFMIRDDSTAEDFSKATDPDPGDD
ncbi:MAG: hypothetical protein KC978_10745 [Candidatus Omnitrophica bacterium]|nr:hypothetical protein [Candidatus Omnitrophota bacterium]